MSSSDLGLIYSGRWARGVKGVKEKERAGGKKEDGKEGKE